MTRLIAALAAALLLAACASGPGVRAPAATDLLAMDREAETAYRQGDYPRAIAAYQALATAVPGDAAYLYRLGNAYARAGQRHEAVRAYQASLSIDPGHARAWHNLGRLLAEQARDAASRSAHLSPEHDPVHVQGMRLMEGLERALRGEAATASSAAQFSAVPTEVAPFDEEAEGAGHDEE